MQGLSTPSTRLRGRPKQASPVFRLPLGRLPKNHDTPCFVAATMKNHSTASPRCSVECLMEIGGSMVGGKVPLGLSARRGNRALRPEEIPDGGRAG